jgi:tetratricopeptide (TPR) repeat protein
MFYAMTGEGRTIGLGEEPLWFPHDAIKFSGRLGMPERFLSFHDGYAALYDYHNGPERKVFVDARLEVIGPDLYKRYLDLKHAIETDADDARWSRELESLGRPAVLAGHTDNSMVGVRLLATGRWHCVWFDPMVAVFVHNAFVGAIKSHEVDFAARHFRPQPADEPHGLPALIASAKALRNYALALQAQPNLSRPLVLLGLDYARRIQRTDPESVEGWKLMGGLESARESASAAPIPRFRLPIDPVFDLASLRATYALRRALDLAPKDYVALMLLGDLYHQRGMDEAEAALTARLIALRPINQHQAHGQQKMRENLDVVRGRLGPEPSRSWENQTELDRLVSALLASGRAQTAVELLDRAYPDESRPWDVADRMATLRLHLGQPAQARSLWVKASAPKRPELRAARIALCDQVEGNFEAARRSYAEALSVAPELFEAHYGLAVLEQDDGRASAALAEARRAADLAPNAVARAAANAIIATVEPYAVK